MNRDITWENFSLEDLLNFGVELADKNLLLNPTQNAWAQREKIRQALQIIHYTIPELSPRLRAYINNSINQEHTDQEPGAHSTADESAITWMFAEHNAYRKALKEDA
jgi:Na+-transporting NADH:ubiquinone oxidoreductase subunit NqrC